MDNDDDGDDGDDEYGDMGGNSVDSEIGGRTFVFGTMGL